MPSPGRFLVEVPTKDRDVSLAGWIASLLNQSYQDFDVVIVNDGDKPVGGTKVCETVLPALERAGHKVWVLDGSHISQAHNHNMVLYDRRFRGYKWIVRCDDDLYPNRFTLESFYVDIQWLESHPDLSIGAIGGLWFDVNPPEDHGSVGDRKMCPEPPDSHPSCTGRVAAINSNWQQRMYHQTSSLMEVEHVYSMCVYNAEAMRMVGGWPEVYGRGVAHGEETDGTYRLHLAGYKLYADPTITGEHMRAPGGIRSTKNLSQQQAIDLMKWQRRLPQFARVNWEPTVAVECRHQWGIGGAQRLFYETVSLLQSQSKLGVVHPIFTGKHLTPEECQDAFGFTYKKHGLLPEYDVLIVIGHDPRHVARAKHKIFYCLFPVEWERSELEEFDTIVGISDYTVDYIRDMWGFEARRIYPSVKPIGSGEKENIILAVCRLVPYKAPQQMMSWFLEFGLDKEGYEFHVVGASGVDGFADYERGTIAFAEEHDSIVLHRNVQQAELNDLYRRAKVLWSANGMMSSNPQAAEHFGYTPVEAWGTGCVPIVYDCGGHRETVEDGLRWKDKDELRTITEGVLGSILFGMGSNGLGVLAMNGERRLPVDLEKFSQSEYAFQWESLIRQVNAMSLELQYVQRISSEGEPIRIAILSDAPFMPDRWPGYRGLTTGFGVVMGELLKRFLEQPDFHCTVLGLMDNMWPKTSQSLPFDYVPLGAMGDPECSHSLIQLMEWAKPTDVLFCLHSPGDLAERLAQYVRTGASKDTKILGYFPIEGVERLNPAVPDLMGSMLDMSVTYCHSGADLIRQHGIDVPVKVAYHGADHAAFAPLDPEHREQIRYLLGLEGKFVVSMHGTNKRAKNYPVLIDAMRILLERGYDDVYMYFHTLAYDSHILGGWMLPGLAEMDRRRTGLPINQHITIPEMRKHRGVGFENSVELWRVQVPPPTPEGRNTLLSALSLVERYGIADLYFHSASTEGWGLPPIEAAACGVPTVVVDDGMVMREVHSKYCHLIQPAFLDTWQTGTKLCLLDPEKIADKIIELKENDKLRNKYAEAQAHILDDLPWQKTAEQFIGWIRELHQQA